MRTRLGHYSRNITRFPMPSRNADNAFRWNTRWFFFPQMSIICLIFAESNSPARVEFSDNSRDDLLLSLVFQGGGGAVVTISGNGWQFRVPPAAQRWRQKRPIISARRFIRHYSFYLMMKWNIKMIPAAWIFITSQTVGKWPKNSTRWIDL